MQLQSSCRCRLRDQFSCSVGHFVVLLIIGLQSSSQLFIFLNILASHHEMGDSFDEKSAVAHDGQHRSHSRRGSAAEQIAAIDAMASAPGVNRQSFAHIDEKKLLRRMDWHLLPILTLLYLLSFIDRGNIVRVTSYICPV